MGSGQVQQSVLSKLANISVRPFSATLEMSWWSGEAEENPFRGKLVWLKGNQTLAHDGLWKLCHWSYSKPARTQPWHICCSWQCSDQGHWTRWPSEVPSNLKHDRIIWSFSKYIILLRQKTLCFLIITSSKWQVSTKTFFHCIIAGFNNLPFRCILLSGSMKSSCPTKLDKYSWNKLNHYHVFSSFSEF